MDRAAGECPHLAGKSGTEQIKPHAMEVKTPKKWKGSREQSSRAHSLCPSSSMPGYQHTDMHTDPSEQECSHQRV